MTIGKHGESFNYLPIMSGLDQEHFPRIVPIAGVFPGLSLDELLKPHSNPAAPPGQWAYDFPGEQGLHIGSVAIPGSELITNALDPVAIIVKNTVLGVSAMEEVEMLVVVDREDREFTTNSFFLFTRGVDQQLSIHWMDTLHPDFKIVGKIVLCVMPVLEKMNNPPSGFLESDDM